MKASELYDAVFEKDTAAIKRAEKVSVLVLDDGGEQNEYAWPPLRLDRVINTRWEDGLPRILTMNMRPHEDPVSRKETLPRAYDRLTGWPGPGALEIDRTSLKRARR